MGRISRQMYKIRRSWGIPVALYRVTDSVVDRKTGQIELVKSKETLRRAVKTPVDERYFKNVQLGDIGLLADNLLPVGREDYFIVDGVRYTVISYQTIDNDIYFHLRQIQKQMRHSEPDGRFIDGLNMEENNEPELE